MLHWQETGPERMIKHTQGGEREVLEQGIVSACSSDGTASAHNAQKRRGHGKG